MQHDPHQIDAPQLSVCVPQLPVGQPFETHGNTWMVRAEETCVVPHWLSVAVSTTAYVPAAG